jgi:NAD(P)-dependent dehydrogenase (short-subunit alcohol dehydrogenase family)
VFADYAGKTPVGRVGKPDDIAQAVAFLISNGFMSGHVIVCDGGLRLAA